MAKFLLCTSYLILCTFFSIGTDYLKVFEYEGLFPENRSLAMNEDNVSEENSAEVLALEKSLKLYPNPAKDELTLEYQLTNGEKGYLEIHSLTGKETLTFPLARDNDLMIIPTDKLTPGIYLYRIIINKETVKTDKLVILK